MNASKYIYLDNNSTTPADPGVLNAMLPYFSDKFGNASSRSHRFGHEAEAAVEHARKQISKLINAAPSEIIFTSGATESVNLAFKGLIEANFKSGIKVITTGIEHTAVLDTCKSLEKAGVNVKYINADEYGIVNPSDISSEIDDSTILVSVMTANNEVGTIQPVAEIAEICRKRNVLFHTDAAQAVGKIPLDVKALGIDMMSFSAHKMYGPKGIGALYIADKKPKIRITEQINGGGHERGIRSGTLNVPAIVGFGKACEICGKNLFDEFSKQTVMRDIFINNLLMRIPHTYLNGHRSKRLPGNANISFGGLDSGVLMSAMKEIACSSGSACASATLQPSHVLKAMGKHDDIIRSALRFGIGRFMTNEELNYAIEIIINTVNKLRNT
jgi:cysteine desulfurase